MLLENLKKEFIELLNYFKNEKKFYEKIIKNLEIINIDKENNLLLIKGSVPGYNGRIVILKLSKNQI
jgi:hypothetical protein